MRNPLRRKSIDASIFGYNMGPGSDKEKWDDLVKFHNEDPFAILLCETADHIDVLTRFAATFGYVIFAEENNGKAKVVVLLRLGLPVKDHGYFHLSDAVNVGDWGAGPRVLDARWINWVRTKVGGRRVYLGASHWPPSVQAPAHSKTAQDSRAKRRGMFARCISGTSEWFHSRKGVRIVYTDSNATVDYFQIEPLATTLNIYSTPSFGRRAIDLFLVKGRNVVVDSNQALPGFSSDHKPVKLSLRIKGRLFSRAN